MTSTIIDPIHATIQAQKKYVDEQRIKGFDSLVVSDAFVRGIRDLGYNSTATALDELIDNSIQATAENIHVFLRYGSKSTEKPTSIAVIDDGVGMIPDMIRYAAMWGGGHREGDRNGFGRYGYGLPSSCVSIGTRFSIISRVEGEDFHKVTIDIDAISAGEYTKDGRIVAPEPTRAKLPEDVASYINEHFRGLRHGTIILLEKIDRIRWKTRTALRNNLLMHMGIVYRNFLRNTKIVVDNDAVAPVDPLFLTEGARYYDLDEERATALPPRIINVKGDPAKNIPGGRIRIRYAALCPTFGRVRKGVWEDNGPKNARFAIMGDHEGIVVLRSGRQIDVLHRSAWSTYRNNDRYWQVEIDFDPSLDEEFAVTTSKQGVRLSDRIWTLLRENGVKNAIATMRETFKEAKAKLEHVQDTGDNKRASEQAMEEAVKFKTRKPGGDTTERIRESNELLQREIERRAIKTNLPLITVENALQQEIVEHPFVVQEESLAGAPFYRTVQVGGQLQLLLNTAHRFYADMYKGANSSPGLRSTLEVLLFVLGGAELDSDKDRRTFYRQERSEWSRMLDVALERLDDAHSADELGDDEADDSAA